MNQLSRTGIFRSGRSFRLQMLLSVAGIFFLLVLSAGYILLSGKHLELIAERGFSRERFIKTIQAGLDAAQQPLQEYLSAASPQALTRIRLISRELREKLPAPSPAARPAVPGEAQLFSLIGAYLDLMDQALAEKEAGTIAAYTGTYNEMRQLFQYIGAELDAVFIEQFHRQVETFEHFIVQSAALQFWNLLFIICVSAFAILLLLRSVGRITTPLVQLSTMTAELSAGNFNVADIKTGYNQEMDRVVEAFNRMKNEMRTYIEKLRRQEAITQEYMQEKMRNIKMESLIRHMEIYTLQAQMNPHFLFNSLNTGMQLAIVEGADRTCAFMENLAKFFRHTTRNKEIVVPLRYELEGLSYYFEILKVRFYRNIDLALDYDDPLLDDITVPVSLIQPLVENCVIHAFKARSALLAGMPERFAIIRPGIVVRVKQQDARLVISVRDNGCGMSPETIQRLLRPLTADELSLSRAMGLASVIQRLYFFYPDDPDVIGIESGEEGTTIFIRIDMRREPCIVS